MAIDGFNPLSFIGQQTYNSGNTTAGTILQVFGSIADGVLAGLVQNAGSGEGQTTAGGVSLEDFQNTIFEQFEGKVTKEQLAVIFQNNDADNSQSLDATEMQAAMRSVNDKLTSAIASASGDIEITFDPNNRLSDDEIAALPPKQRAEYAKAAEAYDAEQFRNMTPDQQIADVMTDLGKIKARGGKVVIDGDKISIDGQTIDFKSKGATDDTITRIIAEAKTKFPEFIKKQDE